MPPSTAPVPAPSTTTQSISSGLSGPERVTTTPRHGCCQRPRSRRQRTTALPSQRTAEAIVTTPHCCCSSAANSGGISVSAMRQRLPAAAGRRHRRHPPVDNPRRYPSSVYNELPLKRVWSSVCYHDHYSTRPALGQRRWSFMTLPVAFRGSSSRNSTCLGTL